MNAKTRRLKYRDGALSSLDAAIEAMNLAKEVTSMTPAKAVFGSVGILLTMIRDSMVNKIEYVELGLACADVCRALDRGMNGKKLDDLNQPVCEAIVQLTTTVAEIQGMITKQSGRNPVSRLVHAKSDKETIATWRSDLNRVLQVFTAELVVSAHMMVSDLHRRVVTDQGGPGVQYSSVRVTLPTDVRTLTISQTQASIPLGELPPPPPRACFGRGELVGKIIGLAEKVTPIALIGAGGIGKTSIALTVLHHDRIKKRFGNNRRFIRCDQFPASRIHFLSRLSVAIGAGVENPGDLTPLRPFLSSTDIIIFLDNAESILDPRGTDAREIYAVVEELVRFRNVCLCITSRISTIPPACEVLDIPTLSAEAARDIFRGIYKNGGQSDLVDQILGQLDFHPLSITLLATVAHHSKWDTDRLALEWDAHRTQVLRTDYNESLAATIELSLASPTFCELGPGACDILSVIAFFPQGINENNLDWLFPSIPTRRTIFDKLCVLSLTYRSNGFVTMLAPLRDYLRPKDPTSSPLLCTTKDCYFHRLAVEVDPNHPGFEEARWIASEDINVEHLLDVFTSVDASAVDVWNACVRFMEHLYWHKRRPVVLGPKIEGLPDDHPTKPDCLFELSRLFGSVVNYVEQKRLLVHTLELWRERGDDFLVAETLRFIAEADRQLGLHKEGTQRAEEALEIYERLGDVTGQAESLEQLASSLCDDEQFDAAEEAASRAIQLISDKGDQFMVCGCHRILGKICLSKGETKKAIKFFEIALGIATTFNWHGQLFWIHHSLARLSSSEDRFDDAHTHVERAKSFAVNDPYRLGRATQLQAGVWYKQRRLKEAKSEALCAASIYEKIGATDDVEVCRAILRDVEEEMNRPEASRQPDFNARGTRNYLKILLGRIFPWATDSTSGQMPNS